MHFIWSHLLQDSFSPWYDFLSNLNFGTATDIQIEYNVFHAYAQVCLKRESGQIQKGSIAAHVYFQSISITLLETMKKSFICPHALNVSPITRAPVIGVSRLNTHFTFYLMWFTLHALHTFASSFIVSHFYIISYNQKLKVK